MKLSARNVLPGTITTINEGPISAEVVIEIAPGVQVTSVITSGSVRSMGLKKGQKAYAVIKSDSVMVGVDH